VASDERASKVPRARREIEAFIKAPDEGRQDRQVVREVCVQEQVVVEIADQPASLDGKALAGIGNVDARDRGMLFGKPLGDGDRAVGRPVLRQQDGPVHVGHSLELEELKCPGDRMLQKSLLIVNG
jgi:hypothetical protein